MWYIRLLDPHSSVALTWFPVILRALLVPERAPLSCPTLERRGSARYALCLPVIFHWDDEGRQRASRGGFTRDVSTAGVFIVASDGPPTSTQVSMEIVLPSFNSAGTVTLECIGTVLRSEATQEANVGFAVSGSFEEKWTRLATDITRARQQTASSGRMGSIGLWNSQNGTQRPEV